MIVGTATPEAQVLAEAMPRDWYVQAMETDEGSNPGAVAYPHHPSEFEYGKSPCYVEIVRTGRQVDYSVRQQEYRRTDDPQWWVYRYCPASKGVPRHDVDATAGASAGRMAAHIASRFARGMSSQEAQELKRRKTRKHGSEFDFGGWR